MEAMRAKVLQRIRQRRYLEWRQKPAGVDLEGVSIESAAEKGQAHHEALILEDSSFQLAAGSINADVDKAAVHSAEAELA